MANKDFENGGAGPLKEKVKGKVESGAGFKAFGGFRGEPDEEKQDLNGGGVAHPDDKQKKL